MEMLIELPDEIKLLIGAIVTLYATQFLKWLSGVLGQDISGHAAELSAFLVASILVVVNAVLSNVPAELAPVVSQLFALAVVVLGAFGAYEKFLKPKAKG